MLFKRRIHGIELLDNPRCPAVIRDGALDYLQFIIRTGHAYRPVAALLAQTLVTRGATQIVDCCSGGGGPWPDLRQDLIRAGASESLQVVLTDAFPNRGAFDEIVRRDDHVVGDPVPVDVENERSLGHSGLRTLFSSFHHFKPATATAVLRNLTARGDPIFIAEVTERSVVAMLFMLLAPLFVWLATPALRPVKLSRLLLTYVLPAIPFVVCFDGVVSCLRTYTPAELRELLAAVSDLPYRWDVGQVHGSGPMAVTFLAGVPITPSF